jgi:leucyl aminopeptidase (aminopeptidase T)
VSDSTANYSPLLSKQRVHHINNQATVRLKNRKGTNLVMGLKGRPDTKKA